MNNKIKAFLGFFVLAFTFVLIPTAGVEAQTDPSYCQGASIYASPSSGNAPLAVSINVDAKTYLKCVHDNALEYYGAYGMSATYTITDGAGATYSETKTYSANTSGQHGSGPDWDQFVNSVIANTTYSSSGNFTVTATVRVESWGWTCSYSSGCFTSGPLQVGRSTASTGVNVSSPPVIKSECSINEGPGGYTKCSNEGGNCSFSGQASVAYGCNGAFNYQNHTNSVSCTNNQFGDPAPGVVKACFYQSIQSSVLEVHVRDHNHNLIGTATYSISPQVGSGSGGFSSYTINPSSGGTQYSITLTGSPAGYTYTHTGNSDGTGTSMTVSPGQTKQFTLYFQKNSVSETNSATLLSYNVPSNWNVCETKTVSVTMRNSGTKAWKTSSNHNLGTYDNVWGEARQSVGSTIQPGDQKTFTWNATAPCSTGTYSFRWRMVEERVEWFGQELSLNISVGSAAPAPAEPLPPPPPPAEPGAGPAVDLNVDRSNITNGENTTLRWSSTNASSCSGSGAPGGWNGNKPTSGSHDIGPNSTITYTITCSNSVGSASDSVTVTVGPNAYNLSVGLQAGSVAGTISGSGISCPGDCSQQHNAGTWVTLIATPGSGNQFNSWSGACAGQGSSCSIQMTSNISTQVYFTVLPPPFDYSLSNSGGITVQKGGIDQYGQVTVTKTITSGSPEAVDLNVSDMPTGVSVGYANRTCSPTCQSTLTFTVAPNATPGTHSITVTGSPLSKTTQFNLIVQASPAMNVTCQSSPSSVKLGETVTWTATASGGTGTGYTYSWSGPGIPTSPAPTTNPYQVAYSTVGQKTAQVTVRDSLSNSGSCSPVGTVQVNFDPTFEEF